MADKRNWGETVLGWFVEREGPPPAPDDADALIKKYAAEPPPPPPVTLSGPLPPVEGGTIDFVAVLEAAGVDATERERVGKAQALLYSLPAETPAEVKRQIVEASLRAFAVAPEAIIEAAAEELQAFEAYIRAGQADTQKVLAEGSGRVAELEAEIARVRQAMEQAVAEQETRTALTNAEKLKVQKVLEFFGAEQVARVVETSTRLKHPEDRGGAG